MKAISFDRDNLRQQVEREARRPVPAPVRAIAEEVRRRHGLAVTAILFYGSCLRDGAIDGRVVDLYVLVDRYRDTYTSALAAASNAVLPPNVYFLRTDNARRPVWAKYAVISLGQFARAATRHALHPSIWGRFAQPCVVVYARDKAAENAVMGALVDAVEAMMSETAPLLPSTFTAEDLWTRGFAESYRTELRAEPPERARQLYHACADRYQCVTRMAFEPADACADGVVRQRTPDPPRWRGRVRWWTRRWLGKALSVFRLAKAAFTFDDGLGYVLWKIEGHTGVRVTPTPWQRRHPLLAGWTLLWRLYRRGAFR